MRERTTTTEKVNDDYTLQISDNYPMTKEHWYNHILMVYWWQVGGKELPRFMLSSFAAP